MTDLDYTHGPGDQVASLHGHGAHHESSDHSLAPQQVSVVEGETQEPRVTHSGVTLPFLNHQVGFMHLCDWLRPQISAAHWLLTAQS